jgi:hypothetical protein
MHRPTQANLRLSAAVLLGAAAASAQTSFHPPIAYATGTSPQCAIAADFDGDGDRDIAITVRNPARLSLLRNLGDGTFAAPEFTVLAANSDPSGLVARDFNADGHPDLVVGLRGLDSIQYLRNLGDGHFAYGITVAVGHLPHSLTAGDFDRDGDEDLAVTNGGDGTVSIVNNLGNGVFAPFQSLFVGVTARGIATGRFSASSGTAPVAPLDLVVAVHDLRMLTFLHNAGDGSFSVGSSIALGSPTSPERPEDVAVADFDLDGRDDIVASLSDTTVQDVGLFLQTTPGVFAPIDYFHSGGTHPAGIAVADFDHDMLVDVAVVNSVDNTLGVLANVGGGLFAPVQTYALLGPVSEFVALADFDGNQYCDIVVTNGLGNSASVLLSALENPRPYCLAAPNSAGLGAHIGATGTVSVAADDLTLNVVGAPASVNGLFFMSQTAIEYPFYAGYLCLGMPRARLGPTLVTDSLGNTSRLLGIQQHWSAAMITPDSVWNFQFWYRDPTGPNGSANFSDALRVVFTD